MTGVFRFFALHCVAYTVNRCLRATSIFHRWSEVIVMFDQKQSFSLSSTSSDLVSPAQNILIIPSRLTHVALMLNAALVANKPYCQVLFLSWDFTSFANRAFL